MYKDIQPIQIDVICDCADCYDTPIFNAQQAKFLQDSGFFHINAQALIHQSEQGFLDSINNLKQSSSHVLFCVGLDQHNKGVDIARYPDLFKQYEHLVYIVTEPIFTSMAYPTAKTSHIKFLDDYEKLTGQLPSLVLYPSKIDCALSPVPNTLFWTNLVDLYCNFEVGFNKKKQGVLAGALNNNVWEGRWGSIMMIYTGCSLLMDFKVDVYQRDLAGQYDTSYQQLCQKVTDSMVQFQPSHGFLFHNLRFLQSWFAGTIPVVVNMANWKEDPDVNQYYPDWMSQHMETCVLTDTRNFLIDMNKLLQHSDNVLRMLENISKLNLTEYTASTMIQNIYKKLSAPCDLSVSDLIRCDTAQSATTWQLPMLIQKDSKTAYGTDSPYPDKDI